jgi:hypothetical protein
MSPGNRTRISLQWFVLGGLALLLAVAQLSCGMLKPKIEKLTLLVTGNALAYVKNCGCAGGQMGGVLRAVRVVRQERDKAIAEGPELKRDPAVLLLEIGNFSDPGTPVKRIESELVVRSLREMHYDMVGLGSKELTWPQQDLLRLLAPADGEALLPLVACNLKFTAPKGSVAEDKSSELNALLRPYVVKPLQGGYRVGIIHAIQTGEASTLGGMYGYELARPADAARAVLDAHQSEADYWVITVSDGDALGATPGGLQDLTQAALVVGFNQDNPNPGTGTAAVRPVFLQPPFHKAKDILRAVQYFDRSGKPGVVSSDHLALRADVKLDDELSAVWDDMQPKLEQLAADEANALIIARKTARPPFHVGESSCIECHSQIVAQMRQTKHHMAYQTLVEKGVETNAACVKCHVVGYGAPWGWNVRENQPNLVGVQCENCHGPASYHLDLYKKKVKPADLMADGRDRFGLLPATEATCVKCHDPDNSPPEGFDFAKYWARIKH